MTLANDCLYKTIGPSEPYEFLSVYPHNAVPSHNLHVNINSDLSDGDAMYNVSVLFKSFPFTATYPVPVYPPAKISRSGLNGLDPCLTLVKQKKAWEYYKDVLLNSCDKSMLEDISSSDDLEEKFQVNVHPNVALLTRHMEKDPDQYFNATYNWYFSGSNIEIINAGDRKYLMRPNGSTGEILFSPLILHKNQWIPESESDDELKFNLKNSNPPCQVDAINNNVLIREKTRICHLRIKESNDKMFIELLCDITGSVNNPFICASLNKENVNEFCTLTPNELLIWNVSLSSPVSKLNLNFEKDNSKDSWGYVHYIGADTALYADRKAVRIFDLRANNTKEHITWPINSLVDICEEISCCNVGSRNINYIGTNHHLLSLDIRQGWAQRWTHGITSSPTMIKILQRNLQDFIFVASQRSDSVVLIQNESEDGNSNISRIHPYLLPSLRESLHLARYNGLCLDHLLTSRFSMSLTGLCCLEDRYINVIRCTSIGDIFWQKLRSAEYNDSHVSTNLSNDDIKKMEEFEFRCEETYIRSDKKCRVTSVRNTEKLIDYLYTSTCPVDEPKDKTSINNKKLPKCKQLKTYCDYLAPVLLEPWDIDALVDKSDGSESASQVHGSECDSNSDEECVVENAVSNWLNTYSQEMSTYIEYSVDEERISSNPNDSDMKEDISAVVEHDEVRLLPDQEMKTSDESSQNIFHNISSIENDTSVRYQCVRSDRFTKEKPVPTTRKKYVSGF